VNICDIVYVDNVCVVDYVSICLYCTTNCLSGTFKFSKSKFKSTIELKCITTSKFIVNNL